MNRHKSTSGRRSPRAVLALLPGMALVAGCGLIGGGPAVVPAFIPPPAKPAVTEQEAAKIIGQYARTMNQAHRGLNPAFAAKVEAGSALQVRSAQYKIFKGNDLRFPASKYTQMWGAAPKFMVHPRWFFAAVTDTGGSETNRDILLFVQTAADQPWRVVYAPISARVTGVIAPGVDVPDVAETVPLDDPTLVIAPGLLPAAHANVLSKGAKSAFTERFAAGPWVKPRWERVARSRKVYRDTHWRGSYQPKPAELPVYAVRTKSGGALVWYAIDYVGDYRATAQAVNLQWENDSWGDMFKPFIGQSVVSDRVRSVERDELVAYIPPKGKGKIKLIAGRWCMLKVSGS